MAELLIEGAVPVLSVGLFLLLDFRTLIRCFGFEPRREKRNPFPALIKKKNYVCPHAAIFGS